MRLVCAYIHASYSGAHDNRGITSVCASTIFRALERKLEAHALILKTSFRVKQETSIPISLARGSHVIAVNLKRTGKFAWNKEEPETLAERHQLRPLY